MSEGGTGTPAKKLRASAEMKGRQPFRFLMALIFRKPAQTRRDTLEERPSPLEMMALAAASVGMDASLLQVLEGLEKSET